MSRFEPSTMLAAQTEGKMLLKMYESLSSCLPIRFSFFCWLEMLFRILALLCCINLFHTTSNRGCLLVCLSISCICHHAWFAISWNFKIISWEEIFLDSTSNGFVKMVKWNALEIFFLEIFNSIIFLKIKNLNF